MTQPGKPVSNQLPPSPSLTKRGSEGELCLSSFFNGVTSKLQKNIFAKVERVT